ncbi:MAG: hypothetical protein KDK30_19135, partial [Leptospiraceae bacterium]|nr:hypothetical protein [Leptospiraceae bacterium]
MNGVIPFYQKHGIWFYSVGTLLLWIASSFSDSVWGLLAMAVGAALALSDPAAMLHARFRNGIQLERGLYVAYILGIVAVVAFFIRFFLVIPPEKLAAGEEAFLPRLRLALLFVFLLSYIASLLYRF